jgi:hypothetical protein
VIRSIEFKELSKLGKLFWCNFDFAIAQMEEMASEVNVSNLFVATTSLVLFLSPFKVSLKICCKNTARISFFLQM